MKIQFKIEIGDTVEQRSDSELVASCLKGDSSAWEALIFRYQKLIYSIPVKSRLSADDAADIFQSVCLKLFEKLSTLRDQQRVSSWLITTTTRECWRVAALRRRASLPASSDDEQSDGLEQIAATEIMADEQRIIFERQQAVRQAVAALPDRCRDMITMLFYQKDDLSYADIARRLNMPISSIGPTRARCLEKLKRVLKDKI